MEILSVGTDREIDAAFAELVQKRVDAFLVAADVVLGGRQTQILTLAARHGLPGIYPARSWSDRHPRGQRHDRLASPTTQCSKG